MTANTATPQQHCKAYDLEQLELAARKELKAFICDCALQAAQGTGPKRRSKWQRAELARLEAKVREAAMAVVAYGHCPQCGRALRRNLSITGWWQCTQFGSEQFRAEPSLPSCSYQTIVT